MSERRIEASGTRPLRLPPTEPDDKDLRIMLDRGDASAATQVAALRALQREFRDAMTEQNVVIREAVRDLIEFGTNANKTMARLVLFLVVVVSVTVVSLAGAAMHIDLPGLSVGTGSLTTP